MDPFAPASKFGLTFRQSATAQSGPERAERLPVNTTDPVEAERFSNAGLVRAEGFSNTGPVGAERFLVAGVLDDPRTAVLASSAVACPRSTANDYLLRTHIVTFSLSHTTRQYGARRWVQRTYHHTNTISLIPPALPAVSQTKLRRRALKSGRRTTACDSSTFLGRLTS